MPGHASKGKEPNLTRRIFYFAFNYVLMRLVSLKCRHNTSAVTRPAHQERVELLLQGKHNAVLISTGMKAV